MNVFNKVTLQSLKKNKTRTIVTIIGIILSAAMICAVTTFASSMQNYALQGVIYTDGAWHGSEIGTSYSTYENISASDKVDSAIYFQQLGYAKLENCTNEYKPYLYLLGASENTETTMSVHVTSGSFPTESNEILLPEHLATNGGVTYKIGDTLTLELGDRMLDGWVMTQNNPNYVYTDGQEVIQDETLEVRETRTYTVVGFYERFSYRIENYDAPGYTALTIVDETVSDDYQYDVYFKMNNVRDVYDFMEDNNYTGQRNSNVLLYQGASSYSNFTTMLVSLAAIVIVLIMFGSVSLIYNAFSISVSERTKQFGLLSSIGATKKQLKKMVLFEALVVAAVGIPIGVVCGIAGIGVTLLFIGNKFTALGMPVEMELCVSPVSVVIAIIVALVTVLISAWIPSRRATKVSAVEAIRQNADIQIKGKEVKTSKLTYKLFGLSGMLASKHYKRNKKKYRTTVMSLFMSIVLFVSASAFTDYLMESVAGGFSTNGYDLWYSGTEEDWSDMPANDVLALFESDKNITQATYTRQTYINGLISNDSLAEGAAGNILSAPVAAPNGIDIEISTDDYSHIVGYVYFVSDDAFKSLLKQYGLSESEFMNPENPLAVSIDGNVVFDGDRGKYTTMTVLNSDTCEIECTDLVEYEGYYYRDSIEKENGEIVAKYVSYENESDIMEIPYDEAYVNYTLRSGKTIYENPYYTDSQMSAHIQMIYPVSMYEYVMPDSLEGSNAYYRFYMKSDNHVASYENLKQVLAENGIASGSLQDYAATVEDSRNIVTIIRVFSYGFIVLISLIAAANVFNTISTNISLRRREFAMLKSVGMTAKGFNKMMNYECLLYGSKALILGLPVSCGITYLIYLAIMEGYETTFHLPWMGIVVAVLSVFAVVFATMMYSMSKVKKDNPIDALKNENL